MEKITTNIKAIIFDMDGTIIHTKKVWDEVTLAILEQKGITTLSDDDNKFLTTLVGMNLVYSSAALKKRFNIQDSVPDLVQQTALLANQKMADQISFIEGFESFHIKLQKNAIPTGVATNASQANLDFIAQKLNFERFFGSNMYTPAHVNNKAKPDPALFLHTAQQLNVAPSECIVFEDSLYGFTAAREAGMKCIAIKNDQNQHLLGYVHDAISTYHEAEAALKKL